MYHNQINNVCQPNKAELDYSYSLANKEIEYAKNKIKEMFHRCHLYTFDKMLYY